LSTVEVSGSTASAAATKQVMSGLSYFFCPNPVLNFLNPVQVQLSVPDLPIGYIVFSLGPQDPRGTPTNCGTHRVNGRNMTI